MYRFCHYSKASYYVLGLSLWKQTVPSAWTRHMLQWNWHQAHFTSKSSCFYCHSIRKQPCGQQDGSADKGTCQRDWWLDIYGRIPVEKQTFLWYPHIFCCIHFPPSTISFKSGHDGAYLHTQLWSQGSRNRQISQHSLHFRRLSIFHY